MGKCRCGHGRQWHRRGQGKIKLPCQFIVSMGLLRGQRRMVCKCRDFVVPTETVR